LDLVVAAISHLVAIHLEWPEQDSRLLDARYTHESAANKIHVLGAIAHDLCIQIMFFALQGKKAPKRLCVESVSIASFEQDQACKQVGDDDEMNENMDGH
jgi:hypothetical protein